MIAQYPAKAKMTGVRELDRVKKGSHSAILD